MLEEHLIFLENLSLKENFEFITKLREFDKDKALSLIKDFNLDLNKKPYQLSSGQRRLFKISLAFSSMARTLLLDEPTSNLDLDNSNIVRKMIKNYPYTVIYASHNTLLREGVCDKIVYLRIGKIEKMDKC
ncbi:hypothetical protein SJAV_21430 [Sulfurisphaera javensis]|uniref:ATPase AAA-type core domain-containing protein n=2 Tax=Sulfurisphaera javensis TaxID=2049879 RepID=A0AAT9GTP0_9CREN